jgi:archaellum component FlaC
MESMRATWTDARLEEFAVDVDRRFDEVDGRLGKVEGRLGKVEIRLGKIETRLEVLDTRMGETNRLLDKIDVDVRAMKAEISANSRSMLQFCGVMVAAQMATVATLIATQA